MISPDQESKLNYILKIKRFEKFRTLLIDAIKNWEFKNPAKGHYGLVEKAGKFSTRSTCCLISSALNDKSILIELFEKSNKPSHLYEFCVEKHFNLTKKEVTGLIRGFDQECKHVIDYDQNAYDFASNVSTILFGNRKQIRVGNHG